MAKLGNIITDWWGLILLLLFIGWTIYIFATAKFWNEEHNYYYSHKEIYEDEEGNDVVTFSRGGEDITFIHMPKKYKDLQNEK